ncbi:MAG: hypothetical protein ABL955_01620 [Elusimicrobiota bacterium]
MLCSPNGAFKLVTRNDIHSSWNLPFPMRFPHPYPLRYPFPDLNRDPSQAPPTNTPNPATIFGGL